MKYARLREVLRQVSANPSSLTKHAPQLCHAVGKLSGLYELAGATPAAKITDARRNELLAKLAAGEQVELEVHLLAYEQKTGERNRNSVRFRDGAIVKLGRSGVGTPFLRDHNQWDSLSKGGTIESSSATKRAEGDYCIEQVAVLKAPWAVEMALRGLMDSVSIGWRPTGPVMCSACNAPVYTKCYHWPGDRLVEKDDEGGGKRKVRASDGPIVVEWIYTEAELVETSVVNVPGVPSARVDDVRASFVASLSATHQDLRDVLDRDGLNHLEREEADMDPEVLKVLGLKEGATAAEVAAAIATMKKKGETDAATLAIVQGDLTKLQGTVGTLTADKAKRDEDTFVTDALNAGKIGKADEASWRALYKLDSAKAVELMGQRKDGTATPVGTDPQREELVADDGGTPEPTPAVLITGGDVPGGLYAVGVRSKVERREIARELALAVKRLETHQNPQARWWAERLGFEGKLRGGYPTLAATSIANNLDLDSARTAFRAVFMQSLEMAAVSPMELLFQTVATNTPLARIHWMGDLPGFSEWIGDRRLSGVEAFKLDLQSKKWANGLRIKNDDVKFDNLGLMPAQIGGLATKARRHRLDRMAQAMIQGFAGGAEFTGLAYDGSFFFADAHRGGNDNKLAVALDAAGLTAADLLLESMTTYDGADALDTHGTHLIVGPKLRATAEKLLTQERLANGEDNYHRGKYKLIVENRFRGTADDYWFLGDLSHDIKPFIYQLVEDISTSAVMGQEQNNSMPSFMNDELLFGAQANYNMSYFEFRLLVGSVVA